MTAPFRSRSEARLTMLKTKQFRRRIRRAKAKHDRLLVLLRSWGIDGGWQFEKLLQILSLPTAGSDSSILKDLVITLAYGAGPTPVPPGCPTLEEKYPGMSVWGRRG